MGADGAAQVEPALVEAWLRGWALSRGLALPYAAFGGWRVDVGLADQKARYVFAALSPACDDVMAAVREPHVFLKVLADPTALRARLAPGWVLQPPSTFMIQPSVRSAGADLPGSYVWSEIDAASPHRVTLIVLGPDGLPAANGSATFVEDFVVFDRIETRPDHRRRGLGRAVMSRLCALAEIRRANTGLLVATAEGRALYAGLGWRAASAYCTAVRASDSTPTVNG